MSHFCIGLIAYEAITHNDQHAGQAGNFSPDLPGTHVDIYWHDQCSLFRYTSSHQNPVATLTLKAVTIGPKCSRSIIQLTKLWHRVVLYVWPRSLSIIFWPQTASYHLYSLAVDSYSVGVLSVPVEELDTRSSVSPFCRFVGLGDM